MAEQERSSTLQQNVRRLADEIRVRLHLAGMEAKDAWSKIEPRVYEFEKKAEAARDRIGEDLNRVGSELEEQMKKLLGRLRKD